jgi:hypothetical protein
VVLDILFAEERCSSSLLSQGVVDAWSDRSFAPKSFRLSPSLRRSSRPFDLESGRAKLVRG